MATVRELLARKMSQSGTPAAVPPSERVVGVAASATVLEAARLMTARGIGGLVVREAEGGAGGEAGGTMAGIFTERDVLRRVVNEGLDPRTTVVRDVMTAPVLTVSPETTLAECRQLFTGRRIRHLPVVDKDGLCGVVTSGDLIAFEADEARTTIEQLEGYVFSNR